MSPRIRDIVSRGRTLVPRSAAWRYSVAALLVLTALAVRLGLDPVLGLHAPYLPFLLAVTVAARLGGRGPGYAATLLGTGAVSWFLLEPRHSVLVEGWHAVAGLVFFFLLGLLVALLVGNLQAAFLSATQAREALRVQAQLVDLSHDAIITMDARRCITAWNRGAEEMYGWTEAEALGKRTHDRLQTSNRIQNTEIDQILHRDGRWEGELNHTRQDGRRLRVESRQVLLRDEKNRPAGILEINRDITERARAEDELRASRLTLEMALKAGRSGTFDWDAKSDVNRWSEELLELYGFKAGEFGGTSQDWIECLIPEDREAGRTALDNSFQTGVFELEFRVRRRDTGEIRWMYGRADVSFDDAGKPSRMVGINVDVTERKRAGEELRRSMAVQAREHEFLESLLANAPYGICVHTGNDLRFTMANPAYRKMVGADGDLIGRAYGELFPKAAAAGAQARLCAVMQTGNPWVIENFHAPLPGKPDARWEGTAVRLPTAPADEASVLAILWDVTERAKLQEALREREAMLNAFFAASPCNLNVFDEGLRFLKCDPVTPTYFGLTAESIIGKSVRDLAPLLAKRILAPIVRRVTETGQPETDLEISVPVPSRGGETAWFQASFFPVPLPGGRQGVGAIGIEITRTKRAEQALRLSEEKFAKAFATNPAVICITRLKDGQMVDVNDTWEAVLGYRREEVIGRSSTSLHMWPSPEDRDRLINAFRENGSLRGWEQTFLNKSGELFVALGSAERLTVAGEDLVLWSWLDIGERKRAVERLRESEQRYRALFESMREGFVLGEIVRDPAGKPVDWRYLDVNPAFETMFARTRGELIGRTCREVFPDSHWQYWVTGFGEVALGGHHARLAQVSQSTGRHYEAIAYSPRPGQFAAIFTDMTERKGAEERLRQAQKLESIAVLAGGVAHDFNNLLTVIMGGASLALEECPSCEHSKAILAASERAMRLTKQLLAYAGKAQFTRKAIDITDLVSGARQLLEASVPKRVNLVLDLANDLPAVEEDPASIEQILLNLVINAGEAIPPKTNGHIEVRTGSSDITPETALRQSRYEVAQGAYVWLEVADDGAGISQTALSRIFDPFFSTKFTGRGLGLAAVDGIVRSSKGFIEVRSSPGGGATFRVYLPASGRKRRPETGPVLERHPHRGSAAVLVVDDEEIVRTLASMVLTRHGYEVLLATNGKHALEVLAGSPSPPAIVLLDLAMPVMGGDELAPLLAQRYPGLKVVISSGYPEEEARKGFRDVPVAGFLQKPYTAISLTDKIDEILAAPQ